MEPTGGVDVTEAGCASSIALDFSAGEPSSSTPTKVPRRIRRRLECRSNPPLSAEEIDAKLKEADLRRQQFHEWLSTKARPKPRSPLWLSQEEDLGQRLEAKLNAAEQKRLRLLANAQMRLARLDELRQAAKTGVEMRFEKQREELSSRVESRVQQAEANRMRLLKAHMLRRAAVQERKSRSLLQRVAWEIKYKERIRLAIFQKRSAAERKRMGLLEAEKSRAQARVMQARKVAKIVCYQRETERRKMKEHLEIRLQKAKRQRAEYLRMRINAGNAARISWVKQGDFLSRKLAQCWRQFVSSKRTTFALAQSYTTLGINMSTVKSMPFEQLAHLIESAKTLQAAKALFDRLESRFLLYQSSTSCRPENIDHLLRRLASPRKRTSPCRKNREMDDKNCAKVSTVGAGKLSRYPARAVLCAYMILGHPNAVFSEQGEREMALSRTAADFAREFELLIKFILDGANSASLFQQPSPGIIFDESVNHVESAAHPPPAKTFRNQLSIFDEAWRSYLYSFIVWKVKDARLLEDDLVRAACQLELSMMQTCKLTSEGEIPHLSHDMKAIQAQVIEDQKLLREKVEHLSGSEGLQRMDFALLDTRSKFFEAKDSGTPLIGHVAHISSPTMVSSSVRPVESSSEEYFIEKSGSSKHVARSLFGGTSLQVKPKTSKSTPSSSKLGSQLPTENELLVNEIVHGIRNSFSSELDIKTTSESSIKAKVKETMETAFWDRIMESMEGDYPDYVPLIELVKEVRDELSEMSPLSWKQDIHDRIDVDILSQVMESGTHDVGYLGKILEFALLKLRKLSAPANEDNLKMSHEKLMSELASIAQSDGKQKRSLVTAMIKGLRFVLEQIQNLKKEISMARIQMVEPIIKGSAGFEYLQKAFSDRYGPPSDAAKALAVTKVWLSSLSDIAIEEWNEYVDSYSLLPETPAFSSVMSLRTGGDIPHASIQSFHPAETLGDALAECTGEKLDVLLRIGLLRLATNVERLIPDSVPETLQLNVLRLASVQSQLQQIIVISTSILVLRQTLISENVQLPSSELDAIASNSVKSLSKLLDQKPDVGIEEIINTIASNIPEEEKVQSRKQIMARVLMKSLQNDDAVFRKVYSSVYLATRAILFGGTGHRPRRLARGILQKLGAAMLLDRVVSTAEVLMAMARVTMQVHGPWYRILV
ncbi:hypothetical protein HPP92_005359 [Vanilla planifolia]|uniref:T-complex protein 11 n=1 Tax=Vanilla planifolia TaxID=51239 RepID=A0A835VET2_VANPL|nr:hypothetical protein HPP92_005359 [Vanilla planifolia]